MSLIGVECNICEKPMPERNLKPIIINLPVENLGDGKTRRISVVLRASASEWKGTFCTLHSLSGDVTGENEVESQILKPEDMDICLECTIGYVKRALEALKS